MQLESENSFTHLPSPQGVCHTAFFTQLQSLDSNEQAVRWEKPMQFAFDRAEGRSQHYSTTTTATQPLQLQCTVLRQELAAAQFALTNCELLAASPLPLQSTSTSSHSCSSLRSGQFSLHNLPSHSYAPTVSEKTREQEQDLQCHRHLHRHSLGNLLDFATGLDPVLPLNTSHGMRVGSIDCIQPSKPLPQSPRVTRKSTGESLTTALTGFASTCDADLPYTRDPTGPFAPESALSTHSPSQTFPHHTAEETLGEDSTLQKFAIIRGTLSSMTGTVHEWFKSAATSLHTWSSHATLLGILLPVLLRHHPHKRRRLRQESLPRVWPPMAALCLFNLHLLNRHLGMTTPFAHHMHKRQ